MTIWPGEPYPLGATWDGNGVNFALFSEHATGVELCLFDGPDGSNQMACIFLTEQTDLVWHGYLPDIRPGQRYVVRRATSAGTSRTVNPCPTGIGRLGSPSRLGSI